MILNNIDKMTKGWFVGPFNPTAYNTESAEVSYKTFQKGDLELEHYQLIATEITLLVSGSARIGKQILKPGDILTIGPMESADFEALSDGALVAFKAPAIPSDKVVGDSKDFKVQFVIPMAGLGSRFSKAGYEEPKPFIVIDNSTMLELVISNLIPKFKSEWVFVAQNKHIDSYRVSELVNKKTSESKVIGIDHITDGPARTVLLGSGELNPELPLVVANSDQFINENLDFFYQKLLTNDGVILTMDANDPKWSFIRKDENDNVIEVQEKKVISNEATVGIYGFKKARYFLDSANSMINKNIRTNNEFYVAPVYNEMISAGMKIVTHNVGRNMYGLGTPEDLEFFNKTFPKINSTYLGS